MRRLEKVFIVLILMSFLMRTFTLPFGTTLFVLSTGSLAVFYAYLGFAIFNGVSFKGIFKKGSFQGVGAWGILLAVFAGLIMAVTVIGIEFRLMHWPSAKILLGGGLIGLVLLEVLSIVKFARGRSQLARRILQRSIPFLVVASICFFLSDDATRHFKFRWGENGIERIDSGKIDRYYQERGH
jgi:uncharacterized membrane protein